MAKKQIQIKISKDGKIESKTVNITGKKCEKYIKYVEELTEARVVDSSYTKDYYITEDVEDVAVTQNMEVQRL